MCRDEVAKQPKAADDGKKAYLASDTLRLIQEMDGTAAPPADDTVTKPARATFNPLAGKYGGALRAGDDAEYAADDPNSPLYKPTETAAYKAAQPVMKNPSSSGPFPTPPQPAYRPIQQAAKRPEPTIVGHAFPNQEVADTVVQPSRTTITLPAKTALSNTNTGGGNSFMSKGPKPFAPTQTE